MAESIINFLLFMVVIIVFASLVSYSMLLRIRLHKVARQLGQEMIDKVALDNKVKQFMSEQSLKHLHESDGFIKFLTESRDSAFRYIEDVQSEISYFIKEVGPIVEVYRNLPTKTTSSQKIVDAYDKLIKLMPEELKNN